MSDISNNPAQNAMSEFQQILDKYSPKGGDPASTPAGPSPINFRFGSEQVTVTSPQELQSALDSRLSQIAEYVRSQQAEMQEKLQQISTATPPPTTQNSAENPVEFIDKFVSDPKKALQEALKGSEIDQKLAKLEELNSRFERQQFAANHALYGNNPNIMQGLEKICKDHNMPITAQSLEIAAGWAQSAGYLPNEQMLRAQQQQKFLELLQAQAAQQQAQGQPQGQPQGIPGYPPQTQSTNPNDYIRTPWLSGIPAPPPTTSNVSGSMPSATQLDQAINLAPQMSAEDLRAFLQRAGAVQ